MDGTNALIYLRSLLNTKLRVHTTDTRMFIGDFKCTDNVGHSLYPYSLKANVLQESNIVLAQSHEYRLPSARALKTASNAISFALEEPTVRADMTSRYLGLIVIPGQYITKIEVEESGDHVR